MSGSGYDEIRLETPGGDVVAYFAPNFEVQPVINNNLHTGERARGKPPIARDQQVYTEELTVQGVFEDSTALPKDHKDALVDLFGKSPVTARDQVNRLKYYAKKEGGPFVLHEGDDEYSAVTDDAVDIQNGTHPAVQISEIRPPSDGGFSRFEYTVKFAVGVSE